MIVGIVFFVSLAVALANRVPCLGARAARAVLITGIATICGIMIRVIVRHRRLGLLLSGLVLYRLLGLFRRWHLVIVVIRHRRLGCSGLALASGC